LTNPLRRHLPLATFVFSLLLLGPAAAAMAQDEGVRDALRAVLRNASERPAVAAPQAMRLVWRGVDVDGDGRGDFANPTGRAAREHDGWGSGHFGDSRDGGGRRHEGVDYIGVVGQKVVAPISGYVTKIGYAYDNATLRYIEITNPALNFVARAHYVEPSVEVGDVVAMGAAIGTLADLQVRYRGITDHVHLELYDAGRRIDAERVIVAMQVPMSARG
jgi:murein DD-endopeptidase MepM/ murein hydrolase activator NlpD